jgi:hypothetical protein
LRRLLGAQQRKRKTFVLENARHIGVLFDAGNTTNRTEMLEWCRLMEKKGKKIELLGYFNRQATEDPGFPHFTPKQCSWWTRVPGDEKSKAFAGQPFDLLLCFNPDDLDPLHYLAAGSKARMKMGYATAVPNDYDILLDTSTSKGPRYFIAQLELYLDKIVLNQHEPAGAL